MPGPKADQPRNGLMAQLRRRWLLCVLVIVAASLGFVVIRDGVESNNRRIADGKARDAAVAAYAQKLSDSTEGAIAIDVMQTPNDYTNEYRWSGDSKALSVKVRFGGCMVDGTFINVPDRPTGVEQIGELMLTLPSVNEDASASTIAATAPNLYTTVMASGLAHCIAGDKRLLPNFSG